MGKPRKKTRTGKRNRDDALRKLNSEVRGMTLSSSRRKRKETPATVEACLERARAALDSYDVDEAFRCCAAALEMDENHVPALETMGAVLLERCDVSGARTRFFRATELQPDEGYAKYMSLAQLEEGEESVALFRRGIEIMEKEKEVAIRGGLGDEEQGAAASADSSTGVSKLEELQADICRGHLSIAEIYLTDLCESPDAAATCKRHLDAAVETRPNAPEAHQLLASWCISMVDGDDGEDEEDGDRLVEAKAAIERSVDLWLPMYQKLTEEDHDSPSTSAAAEAAMADPVIPCPLTLEDRINASKILMELFMMRPDFGDLADRAVEVLDTVLDEDDENIFVWYLLGWIGCMQGKEHYSNSKLSLEQALLLGSKKGFLQSGTTYGVDKEQIEEVLSELKKKMEEENVVDDDEDREDDDDDDDEEGEKVIDENYETDEDDDDDD